MNNKYNFSNIIKFNSQTKNFIIAFFVFIIILGILSLLLFMFSLDFGFYDLIETTTYKEKITNEQVSNTYSVNSLTGKSNIIFIILNSDDNLEFAFCTFVDYDNQSFKVKYFDRNDNIKYNNSLKTVNKIYKDFSLDGLKKSISDLCDVNINKYVIFKDSDLKKLFSSFDGINVNVSQEVDYKSDELSLLLKPGKHSLSGEKALNYLLTCDESYKEKALCDIISSLLSVQYVNDADNLFKKLVNSCKTDISVIDYSNGIDRIKTYCYSEERFLPFPYGEGE